MARLGLWLRWSLRDLRARWLQVAAIAVVIGLGTGAYVGLSSSSAWRHDSAAASYQELASHDLRVDLAKGTTVDADRLRAALRATEHPGWIEATTVRLLVPVQVDASRDGEPLLVSGRLVGVQLDGPGGPAVDALWSRSGRALGPSDDGRPVVVLDDHFAAEHDLRGEQELTLGGSVAVTSVGSAISPEYFVVAGDGATAGFFGARTFATMWTSLATAQEVAGLPGAADQAGVLVAPGADVAAVQAELEAALAAALPDAAVTVTPLTEQREYRRIFDDIDGDQKLFDVFALLVLGGAAFAAFNLVGRVVEAQRREIGIGMSLGVPRRSLAVRPLLFALEVSLAGVVLGVAVGWWFGTALAGLVERVLPTPVWDTAFQPAIYVRGVLLALALTFLAASWPVWRAVRVTPVEAIQVGPRATRGGGLAPLVSRLHLPGGSLGQMPVRDALRRPRRTLLTALAIAAAVGLLVGVLGILDSFVATVDAADVELSGTSPERVTATFESFEPADGPTVRAVGESAEVGRVAPFLRVGGELAAVDGRERFEALVDLLPLDDAVWRPGLVAGSYDHDRPGVLIAQKAANDLGVGVGDDVVLRHPVREGTGYRWEESALPVLGVHRDVYRGLVFMDLADASLMNLDGIVNAAQVAPVEGATHEDLQRSLFGLQGVAAVVPAGAFIEAVRSGFQQIMGVLQLVEVVALVLAVLIAFNSSSISSDERAREHATMVAFGVAPRTVVGLTMVESALVGAVATVIGLGLGAALLGWLIHVLLPSTLPDVQLDLAISPRTFLLAAGMGVVAVGLAPLLTLRRVRRMSVPDTLRAVE